MNYYIVNIDFLIPSSQAFVCSESKLVQATCPERAQLLALELYVDKLDVSVRLSHSDPLQVNKDEARIYACLTSGQKSFLSDKINSQ